MQRIATVRLLLAVLGIAILLFNPAGVCAGTPGAKSPTHPCCPKPAGEKSACICIDRHTDPPVLPALAVQPDLEAAVIAPTLPVRVSVEPAAQAPEVLPMQDCVVILHQILV